MSQKRKRSPKGTVYPCNNKIINLHLFKSDGNWSSSCLTDSGTLNFPIKKYRSLPILSDVKCFPPLENYPDVDADITPNPLIPTSAKTSSYLARRRSLSYLDVAKKINKSNNLIDTNAYTTPPSKNARLGSSFEKIKAILRSALTPSPKIEAAKRTLFKSFLSNIDPRNPRTEQDGAPASEFKFPAQHSKESDSLLSPNLFQKTKTQQNKTKQTFQTSPDLCFTHDDQPPESDLKTMARTKNLHRPRQGSGLPRARKMQLPKIKGNSKPNRVRTKNKNSPPTNKPQGSGTAADPTPTPAPSTSTSNLTRQPSLLQTTPVARSSTGSLDPQPLPVGGNPSQPSTVAASTTKAPIVRPFLVSKQAEILSRYRPILPKSSGSIHQDISGRYKNKKASSISDLNKNRIKNQPSITKFFKSFSPRVTVPTPSPKPTPKPNSRDPRLKPRIPLSLPVTINTATMNLNQAATSSVPPPSPTVSNISPNQNNNPDSLRKLPQMVPHPNQAEIDEVNARIFDANDDLSNLYKEKHLLQLETERPGSRDKLLSLKQKITNQSLSRQHLYDRLRYLSSPTALEQPISLIGRQDQVSKIAADLIKVSSPLSPDQTSKHSTPLKRSSSFSFSQVSSSTFVRGYFTSIEASKAAASKTSTPQIHATSPPASTRDTQSSLQNPIDSLNTRCPSPGQSENPNPEPTTALPAENTRDHTTVAPNMEDSNQQHSGINFTKIAMTVDNLSNNMPPISFKNTANKHILFIFPTPHIKTLFLSHRTDRNLNDVIFGLDDDMTSSASQDPNDPAGNPDHRGGATGSTTDATATDDDDLYSDLGFATPDQDQALVIKQQQAHDTAEVMALVHSHGGLFDNRQATPNRAPTKRKGIEHIVVNETVKADELPSAPAKAPRPAETTLRRLTAAELMPPPSKTPDGYNIQILQSNEMVQVQNIHFLVFMRNTTLNTPPSFPDDETLQQLFDEVVLSIVDDDPEVIRVALKAEVNESGIATIALSTIDMPIFNRIRAGIREYTGCPGFRFETQSKQTFVQKNTATIYVPLRQKRYIHKPLMKFLFSAYPDLKSDYTCLEQVRFVENTPEKPRRKGDTILILGGTDFLSKLAQYDENHVFHMNSYWKLTIKGGRRNTGERSGDANDPSIGVISNSLRDIIVKDCAQETAEASTASSFK